MSNCSEREALEIMQRCPRFERCSAPICPLDLCQDTRDYFPGEPKCGLAKTRRMAIAKGTKLPRKGMTKKEWAAFQRWEQMDDIARRQKLAYLTQISPFCKSDSAPKNQDSHIHQKCENQKESFGQISDMEDK